MIGGPETVSPLTDPESVEANIEALLTDVTPDLLAYFTSRLDNREDAADAVVNTLLTLWRKAKSIPGDHEDARRYAFGVARKVLATARRGTARRTALADRLRRFVHETAVHDPAPDLQLRDALGRLTERDRELVLLVAWEGFTVADAGRVLKLRPDAARARYSRARAKLRRYLSTE